MNPVKAFDDVFGHWFEDDLPAVMPVFHQPPGTGIVPGWLGQNFEERKAYQELKKASSLSAEGMEHCFSARSPKELIEGFNEILEGRFMKITGNCWLLAVQPNSTNLIEVSTKEDCMKQWESFCLFMHWKISRFPNLLEMSRTELLKIAEKAHS